MAVAIMANAFVFHHSLVGGPSGLSDVRSIAQLRRVGLTQRVVLSEWEKSLRVNYWPIFDIAHRILATLSVAVARDIAAILADTADRLVENRLMRSHDLTGAVFQKLIADRKFLAAYYTTPAASALLSGLAITSSMLPSHLCWSKGADLSTLRVGDLACGTGTLMSVAYQRIGQFHELAGGDAEDLHPVMMADVLVGCDVLPAAAHLTASMLAGAHPTTTYFRSSVLTVPYGRQGGRFSLGSLDLLDPRTRLPFDAITAKAADPAGESDTDPGLSLPHGTFDLVVMNPPFTRPTGHAGQTVGVPNPMFAAFGSPKEDQHRMGDAMRRLTKGSCYHGGAGEASAFLALGDRKLRPGGVLAMVMPLGLIAGDSWEGSRKALAKGYTDIVVVSIASPKDGTVAFSSDTRAGDCLIVGRKVSGVGTGRGRRAVFVMLTERPEYPLVGAGIARQIRRLIDGGSLRRGFASKLPALDVST